MELWRQLRQAGLVPPGLGPPPRALREVPPVGRAGQTLLSPGADTAGARESLVRIWEELVSEGFGGTRDGAQVGVGRENGCVNGNKRDCKGPEIEGQKFRDKKRERSRETETEIQRVRDQSRERQGQRDAQRERQRQKAEIESNNRDRDSD